MLFVAFQDTNIANVINLQPYFDDRRVTAYLASQANHRGQVLQVVLAFQLDLEDLENLELLGLLVGLGCLDLEGQGLLLGHLILAAL